jgi:hypothetical protein
MATINPTLTTIGAQDGSVKKAVWSFTGSDTGVAIRYAEWADRSVQMSGTWNGATVLWEGSNDGGTTYLPLTDPQGNAISKTADAIEAVTEICELARPRVSAGSVTAVTVTAILRREQPHRI